MGEIDKRLVLEKTRQYVKESLKDAEPGHDWLHIERVCKVADTIARAEGCDLFIVEMAALLHDIDDFKFNDGDGKPDKTMNWLSEVGVDKLVADKILHIVENVSFKGSGEKNRMTTSENISLKKYCKVCRKHTVHKERKKLH